MITIIIVTIIIDYNNDIYNKSNDCFYFYTIYNYCNYNDYNMKQKSVHVTIMLNDD